MCANTLILQPLICIGFSLCQTHPQTSCMEGVHVSYTSHMTSMDFSTLNVDWILAFLSRFSICLKMCKVYSVKLCSVTVGNWRCGCNGLWAFPAWLFYCYCFWLRSTEHRNSSLIPPFNPPASDNTNHKNPVEPITSLPDAVCLANQA